jgi:SAM-dependent methyltransferase
MYLDVAELRTFYADRLGQTVRGLIGQQLVSCWPSVAGRSVLGLGFASPYLDQFSVGSERTLALMPAAQGVMKWPTEGANAAALVLDDALPLPDASIELVLAVHSLEAAEDVEELLQEIWRVLTPGGRLMAVVPNRRGLWSRFESTPFGHGRPFSHGQIAKLLRDNLFSLLNSRTALAMPPLARGLPLRNGAAWERVGRAVWPAFSGVLIVEAEKQLYQAVPARKRRSLARAVRPVLVPANGGAAPAPTRGIEPAVNFDR